MASCLLPLRGGKFAIIDQEDYEKVSLYNWRLSGPKRCKSIISCGKSRLHLSRLIMNPPPDKLVDHANHNKLDNRKSNLRICSCSENGMNRVCGKNNSLGIKGIARVKDRKAFCARIQINNKSIYLGYFKQIEGAIEARKQAELKYFGEFRFKQ